MAKPFDATTRELIELDPVAWLEFLHIPVPAPDRVRVIDSDVSTVTAAADKVVWVEDQPPWIVHFELQASRDVQLPDRLYRYNALLSYRHGIPVRSVVVLFRPVADGPELSGALEKVLPGAGAYLWFRYDVVRVWRQPVEAVLAGGLATLPLAPVTDVGSEDPQRLLRTMLERLRREAPPHLEATLWASTEILMGLRYRDDQVDEILAGVHDMILGIHGIEESSIYQRIFKRGEAKGREEGREEEARDILLLQGHQKLGEPDERVQAEIAAITDLDRLHDLLGRIPDVSSWDELLPPPAPSTS
jgi:predicted transposase YdaD